MWPHALNASWVPKSALLCDTFRGPQICLGGSWRAWRANQWYGSGVEQLAYNVEGQVQVAATAFAALCFGLLVMLVALVYRGLKQVSQRDENRVHPLVSISNSMPE